MGFTVYRKRMGGMRQTVPTAVLGKHTLSFNQAATRDFFEHFWDAQDGRIYYVTAYYEDPSTGRIALKPVEEESDLSLCVNWTKKKYVTLSTSGFVRQFGIDVKPRVRYAIAWGEVEGIGQVMLLTPWGQAAASPEPASATPAAKPTALEAVCGIVPPDIDETQDRPQRGRKKGSHPGYRCAACKHTHVGWKYGIYKTMGMHPRECPQCGGTDFELNPEL